MNLERPDLSQLDAAVRAYIEALEAEVERLSGSQPKAAAAPPLEPSEPPTTLNVVTVSRSGLAKRTPRHFYSRQRRGGMGIFDLDSPADDPPAHLLIADEGQDLILITNEARVFRFAVEALPESPVRSRGQALTAELELNPGEQPALILAYPYQGYLVIATQQGQVRRLRHHFFGPSVTQGSSLYDIKKLGVPIAACWTSGENDLFIATRQGRAIRFAEQQIPAQGCLGLRLTDDDAIVAVAAVEPDGGVFLLSADGKGTIRLMSGFSANKAPGAGGKAAMRTDQLIGATAVGEADDIFVISRLGKIIRFQAAEVPATEGVVQGVNCMALRADETTALARSLAP